MIARAMTTSSYHSKKEMLASRVGGVECFKTYLQVFGNSDSLMPMTYITESFRHIFNDLFLLHYFLLPNINRNSHLYMLPRISVLRTLKI